MRCKRDLAGRVEASFSCREQIILRLTIPWVILSRCHSDVFLCGTRLCHAAIKDCGRRPNLGRLRRQGLQNLGKIGVTSIRYLQRLPSQVALEIKGDEIADVARGARKSSRLSSLSRRSFPS